MIEQGSPRHIGIILDGNRRFAKRLMKKPWMGHEWGARKVESALNWCKDANVKMLTLYSFSIDNLKRPKEEFKMLMNLFEKEFRKAANHPDIHRNKVRINVIGQVDLLPESTQEAIKEAVEATKDYSELVVNFAIAYGGRKEIVDATKKIAKLVETGKINPEDIDEGLISKNLYLSGMPDPELIIRTGGEKRLSDFLMWESPYSELCFVDKLWPEFNKEDFLKAIEEFKTRQRRFGK
ncbi:MAG: di-trans,poly-cis-decaprenylcistransferase [Candidatus Omnitrophica bacterium]|nr:di-trans,poly-cis-decaprenylcistransferase [Candidatus Omnitrophota bacterium]